MGILKTIKKAARNVAKSVAKAAGVDTKPPKPKAQAQMGPQGDAAQAARMDMAARRRSRRGGRGRDSTIITAGSQIGSRTLLG